MAGLPATIPWAQDLAFDELQRQKSVIAAADGTNEATTRLRAIDTIVFDVLRWPRTSVETEKYCRKTGFSDYAFLQGEDPCLILEAKKNDTYFALPLLKFSSDPVSVGFLAKQCADAEDALLQALQYASVEGARYVAITNGHQWILSLAYVQAQHFHERSILVFDSLTSIESRFSQFFDTFGPQGIYGNSPSAVLLESRKAVAPPKLSQRITSYPVPANRNVISNELSTVLSLVWDELNTNETTDTFLKECYIRADQAEDELLMATALLRERVEENVGAVAQQPRDVPRLINRETLRPIVVLGRVGHGKSTFLRYLRLIEAKAVLQKYIQIDVDFIDRPDKPDEVGRYVYDCVEQQLLERYDIDPQTDGVVRSALRGDLARFRKSPHGKVYQEGSPEFQRAELDFITTLMQDRHAYLSKLVADLCKGRGMAIAIFFDNLDKRIHLQDEAFLKASAIARDWNAVVFVCLRPDTFYHSKDKGVLDSLAPSIVSIAAPPVNMLLKKRFAFAQKVAGGDSVIRSSAAWNEKHIAYSLPTTAVFLECCEKSFFKQRELTELFVAAANGDLRDVLRLVRQVLTSQHLNTEKILEKINDGGYTLSEHEAMRALLFGDCVHFDPRTCIFSNLLDIKRSDPQEHFSRFLCLKYLDGQNDSAPDYGFVQLKEITSYLCQLGYTLDHADGVCESLYASECIEGRVPSVALNASQGAVGTSQIVRITQRGRYLARYLILSYEYIDAVVVDTPIIDDAYREAIVDERLIKGRVKRAGIFVKYLRECSKSIQDASARSMVEQFLVSLEDDIADVGFRVDKAEQRHRA